MASTVKDTINLIRNTLSHAYPAGEVNAFVDIIFQELLGYSRVDTIMREHSELPSFVLDRISNTLERLLNHEPIQHIFGVAHFAGHRFRVTPATLIPRPETAQLVDIITDHCAATSDLRVLDIGTGSGCIAISLALALKWPKVYAVDISPAALNVARDNAATLRAKVNFSHCDILTATPEPSSLDIIVSNPPYIDECEKVDMEPNVLNFEPHSALFVPNDDPLLFYRAISHYAMVALVPGGHLYFEINPRHVDAMRSMLSEHGWDRVEATRDFYGKYRFVSCSKPLQQ